MITHPAADLFPLMAPEELEALVADIAAHGQREPILLDPEGCIVDGRNRWHACAALGIKPMVEVVRHTGSVVDLVVSLNLHRRHLTSSQKAAIALEVERQLAEEKRAHSLANLRRGDAAPDPQTFADRGEAREAAARLVGTNRQYISDAKRIAERAPELLPQIRDGAITIADAKRVLKAQDRAERVESAARGALPPTMTLIEARLEDAVLEPDSVDLVLTDPPYGVSGKDIARYNGATLARDFGEWDRGEMPISDWARRIAAAMKPGATAYVLMSDVLLGDWRAAMLAAGLTWRQGLVWHKTNPPPQVRQVTFTSAHEMILCVSKGVRSTWNWQGETEMRSVLYGPVASDSERLGHPTTKPGWLLDKLIRVSGLPGLRLLDPFAGSGTTGAAALRAGMSATLIEPDPNYCQMILARLENGHG